MKRTKERVEILFRFSTKIVYASYIHEGEREGQVGVSIYKDTPKFALNENTAIYNNTVESP